MEKIRAIKMCAHCGNKVHQEVIHKEEYYVFDDDDEDIILGWGYNFVAVCDTCRGISIYLSPCANSIKDPNDQELFIQAIQLYPENESVNLSSIPDEIKNVYREALKVKFISPIAFVVLIRLALEHICREKNSEGKDLYEKLKYLADKKVFPEIIEKASYIIRKIGNAGAHASGAKVTKMHVEPVNDFFLLVLEYLYIAPNKLQKFEEEFLALKNYEQKKPIQ